MRKPIEPILLGNRSFNLISALEMSQLLSKGDHSIRRVVKDLAAKKGMSITAYVNMILVRHIKEISGE